MWFSKSSNVPVHPSRLLSDLSVDCSPHGDPHVGQLGRTVIVLVGFLFVMQEVSDSIPPSPRPRVAEDVTFKSGF